MENISEIAAAIAGLAGVALGYFIGFRGGRVAGELAALKASQRHRRSSSGNAGRDQRNSGSSSGESRSNDREHDDE